MNIYIKSDESSVPDHMPSSLIPEHAQPWIQLAAGVLGMVAIANLQYGWTLFVDPIEAKFHWGRSAIQVAFTLFVLAETWLVPIEGYLVDRIGPRPMVALGGILVGCAWMLNARAGTLGVLYLAAVLGGAGAGIVYGTSIGNALKWFPHRRGLAAGITAAAFGAGSALTVLPISTMIRDRGFEAAFFWFGLGQGTLVLAASLVLRAPAQKAEKPFGTATQPALAPDASGLEMMRTPIFWLVYAMFTLVATGGLMAAAQLGPIARHYEISEVPVSLFGITAAALPFALALDRILNGVSRPFFGWVSDHVGRENTLGLALVLEGLAILLFINYVREPAMFVILTGLTFFAWGEIYSLFPALCGDLFGRKYATTNYGLLYTAKGTAALLVPVGSLIQHYTGSWKPVFMAASAFDFTAALLALCVLKPWRLRWLAKQSAAVDEDLS
jgi:OFA family oxalate/formate antiporter-like MFS transporter